MSMNFSIRRMDVTDTNDIGIINDFNKASFRRYPAPVGSAMDNESFAEYMECMSISKDDVDVDIMYGAFDGDKMIGYLHGGPALFDEGSATPGDVVFTIEVDDQYRKSGIGSKLLHTAFCDYADSYFYGFIDTDNKTPGLKAFYEKNGFDVSEFYNDGLIVRTDENSIVSRNKTNMIENAIDRQMQAESMLDVNIDKIEKIENENGVETKEV